MATWIDADAIIALTTASLFYALGWFAVRKRSRGTKWMLRSFLLALVFTPAVWLALFGDDRPFADRKMPRVSVAVGPSLPMSEGAISGSLAPVEAEAWNTVRVFYGTDRAQLGKSDRVTYGSSRASRLEVGLVDVSVPKAHKGPLIERPWSIRVPFTATSLLQQKETPEKHFTIREIEALSPETFLMLARARLKNSTVYDKRAVVFVHGYNTDFDYAIFRTAQMANDLKFDGAAFLYSWPSQSGVTGYVYDRDSSEQSQPYLKAFLALVIKETGAKKISLIAHSMGNRPMLHVLRQIDPELPDGVKIDQVILAAPDVDRDVFEQLVRGVARHDRGITLYASKNDRAMKAARLVSGGVPRAGDVPAEGPVVLPGVDTIDISATSNDNLLNHSIYAQSRVLISDIAALIRTGERLPDKRLPVLERVVTAKGVYWRYPQAKSGL